jgi:hypothetical protein
MAGDTAARAGFRAYAVAVAAGVALWLAASAITGRREAWDAGLYWTLFYPLSLVACALLGYRFPERPWRWALGLFFGECLAMGLRNGELGNLFPLGLVVFGVLSLPGVFVARFAGRRATSGAADAS